MHAYSASEAALGQPRSNSCLPYAIGESRNPLVTWIAVDRIRSATIVLAQVTFKQHALDEFTEFDHRILAMPEVVEASRVSGSYDYLLRVIVHDVHHWKDIARLLLGGEYGVEKIVSHFLMDEVKPFSGYALTPRPQRD